MDFSKASAESVLLELPDSEDNRWELKSATMLEVQQRGPFKEELSKQVSAFANSGGGYFVLGISDDKKLEACTQVVGRQSMKDFLSTMTEQSVEPPISSFRVHRIPFESDVAQSIFVIEISDSPLAPHQSTKSRYYFYRIDGHSKPAPHFHLELLRQRRQRCVLQIEKITSLVSVPGHQSVDTAILDAYFDVSIRNVSSLIANPIGINVTIDSDKWRCFSEMPLQSGIVFPTLSHRFQFSFKGTPMGEIGTRYPAQLFNAWAELCFSVQAFSQDYSTEKLTVIAGKYFGFSQITESKNLIPTNADVPSFLKKAADLSQQVFDNALVEPNVTMFKPVS